MRHKSPTPRLSSGISSTNGAPAQVLRYSVLGLGVFYGFSHQRNINATQKAAAAEREYEHKQELIKKAKDAYAKSKQQPSGASAPASSAGEFYLAPILITP